MTIPNVSFVSAEQYIAFVQTFVSLADKELTRLENIQLSEKTIHTVIERIPAIISIVNTIGYLRGQDNVFVNDRPVIENQTLLYEYEDYFEKRLRDLINAIKTYDKDQYLNTSIEKYFLKTRTAYA